ncbi:MAG: DNA-directed RNA polymerase subunit alpha [Bacteroidetes bacterium]|nr:MAG: DNA-directed RNA polymerase subunit alpha [Bacteroidota bacterium]TAG89275.1 MAG: DNA-directed RNA polymerase subunit alpha [Bacteroidota bacterium]
MSLLSFQMPDKVLMEKSTDFHGTFEFKPLEKGFGVTVGNAIRRVLLSSLEGYAITAVRIPGVLHEFSSIKGVVQDVSDIILNLKQVRFKKVSENEEDRIVVRIQNQDVFTAGDIAQFSESFEILNPDLVICDLEETVEMEVEICIGKGRGYVPSEENNKEDKAMGYIAIDSIHTPIKNVKYSIENTRVEQRTDYEKLILDIETDGCIHPEDALKGAAKILIQHFLLFSDQNIMIETTKREEVEEVDEHYLHMRKLLKTTITDLDLSVRAYNCLKSADIKCLGDLVKLDIDDMMKFRNFGKKSLTELEQLVADKQLQFGMDVSKYKLDED